MKEGKKTRKFNPFSGHQKILDLLIKNEANFDTKSISGYTPLHIAAQEGAYEMELFLFITSFLSKIYALYLRLR